MLETKEQRIIIIPSVGNATADISSNPQKSGILRVIEKTDPITKIDDSYYIIPEPIYNSRGEDYVYNFPFLLNQDGSSWEEANDYLFQKSIDNNHLGKDTAPLRRVASQLLDYKIFCDANKIDYLDLSARRPSGRPLQRYFVELVENSGLQPDNINTRTGIVYSFYKHLSKQDDYNIDIDRVDTTRSVKIMMEGRKGGFTKTVQKRSMTLRTSKEVNPVNIGYVRDEGEDLRPLSNKEFDSFVELLHNGKFDVDERLMCRIALFTGARKQTILTMRMKHLELFTGDYLLPDGTYALHAGNSSDIDSKFNKKQTLYFPKGLAEQIVVYANSKSVKKRREKFRQNLHKLKSEDAISDDDIYLFLSNQGNCHYMARNDYRHAKTKSKATGQRTDSLCKKLLKYLPDDFPQDFTFHWLRATFGHKYYQYLMSLVEKDIIKNGEVITRVQARMHHSKRETTENYLKLFLNINDRIKIQEMYENQLFAEYQDTWED